MKEEKEKCRYCRKGGKLKYYVIADDLENPRPYHKKCIEKMKTEALMFFDEAGEVTEEMWKLLEERLNSK